MALRKMLEGVWSCLKPPFLETQPVGDPAGLPIREDSGEESDLALVQELLSQRHADVRHTANVFIVSFTIFLGIHSALLTGVLADLENRLILNILAPVGIAVALTFACCVYGQIEVRHSLQRDIQGLHDRLRFSSPKPRLVLLSYITWGSFVFTVTTLLFWILFPVTHR